MGYKTEEMSKSTAKTYILDVTGMSCGSCAKTLEKAVTDHLTASKPGILTSVKADSTANTVTIQTTQCVGCAKDCRCCKCCTCTKGADGSCGCDDKEGGCTCCKCDPCLCCKCGLPELIKVIQAVDNKYTACIPGAAASSAPTSIPLMGTVVIARQGVRRRSACLVPREEG